MLLCKGWSQEDVDRVVRVSSVESVSCARVGCGVRCTVVWWCLLVLVCVGTQCVPGVATRVAAKIYRPFLGSWRAAHSSDE